MIAKKISCKSLVYNKKFVDLRLETYNRGKQLSLLHLKMQIKYL